MWFDLIERLLMPLRWLWITLKILYKEDQLLDMISEYEVMRSDIGIYGVQYDTDCFELFQDIQEMKQDLSVLKQNRSAL